jgi:radical SAM C-methyltransferase
MLDICLVQQGAWDMPVDSMPLAVGYLKAAIDSDESLAGETTTEIFNFRGGKSLSEMAKEIFTNRIPDVMAFSVLGWNYRTFGVLAETFKQLNPAGLAVFGGNHVAYQQERVFREFPWVDVVVNGEGERTFPSLIAYLASRPDEFDPAQVAGIAYKRPDGSLHTTAERGRIEDLDTVASPFLSGAIPMMDRAGNFRYDVALMETNRGCPYKCSFCYWGGAVGQRMRTFSKARLAEEIDLFGFCQAPSIVLCDSNFGLLESDEEFVELLIKTREKYGYPRALITSWAKNKSQRFYNIVKSLKHHEFHSLFTLALQTLSDDALTGMLRKNMKVNQWENLVEWLTEEGLDCYGELIWGAPGETPQSFFEGYDRLATRVPRIAVYPMLLLPNTSYSENRDAHGFVTVRGQDDDFEYVLANRSSTIAENLEMHRFVYWARVVGEHQYFRHIWRPAREVANLKQSQIISSLKRYFEDSAEPLAQDFVDNIPVLAESPAIAQALRTLHSQPILQEMVQKWWEEMIIPEFPQEWQPFAQALFEFEKWSRAVYVAPGGQLPAGWHSTYIDGVEHYVSDPIQLSYDIEAALQDWPDTLADGPAEEPVTLVFTARPGYYDNLDNYELAAQHFANPRQVDLAQMSS